MKQRPRFRCDSLAYWRIPSQGFMFAFFKKDSITLARVKIVVAHIRYRILLTARIIYCVDHYMLLTQNISLGLFGTMLGEIENSVKSQ